MAMKTVFVVSMLLLAVSLQTTLGKFLGLQIKLLIYISKLSQDYKLDIIILLFLEKNKVFFIYFESEKNHISIT